MKKLTILIVTLFMLVLCSCHSNSLQEMSNEFNTDESSNPVSLPSLSTSESNESTEEFFTSNNENVNDNSEHSNTSQEEQNDVSSSEPTDTNNDVSHETSLPVISNEESSTPDEINKPDNSEIPDESIDINEPDLENKIYYLDISSAVNDFNNQKQTKGQSTDVNAIAKVENNCITLLSDITNANIITFTRDGILDLNGHTIALTEHSHLMINKTASICITGQGLIEKHVATNEPTHLIKVRGALYVANGTFELSNKLNGKATLLDINNGVLTIEEGLFKTLNDQNDSEIISAYNHARVDIQGGLFQTSAFSGIHYAVKITDDVNSLVQSTLFVSGGTFHVYAKSGLVRGIAASAAQNIEIKDCAILAQTVHETTLPYVDAVALELSKCKNVTINSGKFTALQTDSVDQMDAQALYDIDTQQLVINDGEFYGQLSMISSPATINGGIFSGIYVGLQLHGNYDVHINGGTFESPWHGGLYVSNKNTVIKNATLGAPSYQQSYMGQNTDFVPKYENGDAYKGTFYSCIYIGGPDYNVSCTLDSCKFEHLNNIKSKIAISISTNYGYKNSTAILTNIKLPESVVRVDGVNDGGHVGCLIIGPNTTIQGTTGSGQVKEQ